VASDTVALRSSAARHAIGLENRAHFFRVAARGNEVALPDNRS
jgi:hypothetical protein